MEMNVQIPAIISAAVFLFGALFQILLVLGFPLAEFSWGGKYKGVLPPRLRLASSVAAILLLIMALVLFIQTKIFSIPMHFIHIHIVVWIITVYMGLNTLGNLSSKNKKEKLFMTPQTAIAFVSCLLVAIFSV